MTVTTMGSSKVQPARSVSFFDAVTDTMLMARRGFTTLFRIPQLLVFSTIQPVIFVLMFRYVFGGAINIPGFPYVDYLMPGIFAQSIAFGAMSTAVGLASDLKTGMLDRFQSLPMARSAVLAGRTLADAGRNVFVIILMSVVGFAVGFRVHTNAFAFVGALLLVLSFGYALSWVFATVGLAVRDPETAQAAGFPVIAPMVFASSAFVPIATMPGWLQVFARHQPLSVVVTAARALVLGGPTARPVLYAVMWIVGILVVFAPIAVRMYRRAH